MPNTTDRGDPPPRHPTASRPVKPAANSTLEGVSGITLRRLRIFWAVAHADTLTRASKQLGLTQPSLSQQLAKLEEAVGVPLFDRRSHGMILTEAGTHLLRSAEPVLSSVQRLEEGLFQISEGRRQTLHLAGVDSVLRVLLPQAMRSIHAAYPHIDYDIHESSPGETLDLLYSRRVNMGLVGANSIAAVSSGFVEIPVFEDPYVLAVPATLDLDRVVDPVSDLTRDERETLGRSIQFVFGTPHAKRVQMWYDQAIPGNWPFTRARSFEVALGVVRAGLGVCLAPALSTVIGERPIDGLRLYRVHFPPRRIVALLPAQYARQPPYAALVTALQQAGAELALPPIHDTPPFLADCTGVVR